MEPSSIDDAYRNLLGVSKAGLKVGFVLAGATLLHSGNYVSDAFEFLMATSDKSGHIVWAQKVRRTAKIKYDIGNEILVLKRSLHNSTLRGRVELSFTEAIQFFELYRTRSVPG